MTKDNVNLLATVLGVVVTLITIIVTCSRAFDRIANHEERIGKIEKHTEERDEKLGKTLEDLKGSAQYQSWRMDMVIKQLEGKKR